MRGSYLLALLLLAGNAAAFQCEDMTLQQQYERADHVFVILVTDTRLEDGDLLGIPEEDAEAVRLVSAGFEVIERFKGSVEPTTRLLDLLGIGTGYVGLTPGLRFLVLAEDDEEVPQGYLYVNLCTALLGYMREEEQGVRETLSEVRSLAENN